jgi:hypothetical protein
MGKYTYADKAVAVLSHRWGNEFIMRTLRQLQLDNCGLPFLFLSLSKRRKPMAMDTARKIKL